MKRVVVFLALLSAFYILGEDFTTTTGTVYKEYTVIDVTRKGVRVRHSEGVTNVPAEELPADLREKYGAQIEAAKSKWNQEAPKREALVIVKQILYILLKNDRSLDFRYRTPKIIQMTSQDSALVQGMPGEGEKNSYVTDLNVKSHVDGEQVFDHFWPTGNHSYTSTSNAVCTVHKFTASFDLALRTLCQPQLRKLEKISQSHPEIGPMLQTRFLLSEYYKAYSKLIDSSKVHGKNVKNVKRTKKGYIVSGY